MLKVGVDLACNHVRITALSEGFVFLDELSLCMDNYDLLDPWVHSLLLCDDEVVSWFFCEKKFLEWTGRSFFFDIVDETNRFFLVKDRVVLNIYKMCCDLLSRHSRLRNFELSHLLAASQGFVDDAYISPYVGSMKSSHW